MQPLLMIFKDLDVDKQNQPTDLNRNKVKLGVKRS